MSRFTMVFTIAQIFMLTVAVVLCYYGLIAWYVVPLSLVVIPALGALAVIAAVASASRNGGNPFN